MAVVTREAGRDGRDGKDWTFLTNHGHVMLCLARDPQARLRDVAQAVGITERAAQGIVNDLVAAGYVGRARTGRRNEYTLDRRLQLRHPLEREHAVGELLDVLTPIRRTTESRSRSA